MWRTVSRPLNSKRERFDIDSGQIFTETIVKVAPRATWIPDSNTYPNVFFDESRKRVDKGAPALEDIAVRSFLRNIHAVTFDTLMGLHWRIGKRLWKLVEDLDLATVSVWWAFAAAFPEEEFCYYRACEIIPTKTFPEYIEYLSCPNFEWLTCLTLSKISLERADIMRVSELTNLVGLDVNDAGSSRGISCDTDTSSVDDQVIRNWGRRAQEMGSFSKLRVIILRNQQHATSRSLQYLCMFPVLTLFGVSGCGLSAYHGEKAQEHGWTLDDSHGILAKIKSDIDKSHTWDGALTACVKHSAGLVVSIAPDTDAKDPPILSYRLGHTSSDVLYSVPLVFFRCFERDENDACGAGLSSLDTTDTQHPLTGQSMPSLHGHLDKKRKIKMSAQRSFDSTLVDLGIDVAPRPSVPPKSTSDISISTVRAEAVSETEGDVTAAANETLSVQSFAIPSSSTPSTPNGALNRRRQARNDRDRPWRYSPGKKS